MRYLSIFTLLVASSSLASASFLNFTCVPGNNNAVANAALVTGGSTTTTCDAFAAPAGSVITNVLINFFATFQDSVNNGNHQLTYSGSGAFGSFAAANTGIDPNVSFVSTSGNTAQNVASTGGTWLFTTLVSNTVGTNVLPQASSYTVSGTYTYEVQGGVPEPSTLALVGGVLVLAGIRKFRS